MNVIMSVVEGQKSDRNQLDAALALAKLCDAHIAVAHFRPDPRDNVPWMGEGVSADLVQQMMDAAEQEYRQRGAAARAAFDEWTRASGLPVNDDPLSTKFPCCSWREATGRAETRVAEEGRLADFIVLARPDDEGPASRELVFENAVFSTGRPVLVVPPAPQSFGRTVAIFWNGSVEAVRAVAASLPVLRKAERVYALNVSESGDSSAAVAGLPAYLSWHGVRCTLRPVDVGSRSTVEALTAEAKLLDADLVVMGAYTHSRFRELILGGVTRDLVRSASLPLLMAH